MVVQLLPVVEADRGVLEHGVLLQALLEVVLLALQQKVVLVLKHPADRQSPIPDHSREKL